MITTTLRKPVFWKQAEIFRCTLGGKAHKGKAFLRQLTAQRVYTFLQKETAVSARFWTEDLSRVRRTWWPLHYRNLQPGLSLSFPSHASWNTNQTADCVALFNLQMPSIFSSKLKKIPVFCWNPQDFHFCINYRFSDGLRPSWPQSLCSVEFLLSGKLIEQLWKIERLFPPSFEQGTFRVLGERDNDYTTETCLLEASRNL